VSRRFGLVVLVLATQFVAPGAALAHDAPENAQSKWVMVDWMMDAFFLFAGFALVAFVVAWKAGHFHDLEKAARIPLLIHEEDYYTPDWALDEGEWADGDAQG
jgi:cbb3-type cytochrome oxidase maturation FixS-like protein